MVRRSVSALLLAACVPSQAPPLELAGQSLVVVGPDGVHAYAAPFPDRAVLAGSAASAIHFLAYDAPLAELALEPDDEHRVAQPLSDADDAWPLPPPDRWARLAVGSSSIAVHEGGPLPPALAAVRLRRPHCPLMRTEPVPFIIFGAVTQLLPLPGGDVLIGVTHRDDLESDPPGFYPPTLHRLRTDGVIERLVPPSTATHIDPLIFLDDGQPYLVWGAPDLRPGQPQMRVHAITSTGGFGAGTPLHAPSERADDTVSPVAISAGRSGGRRTLAMMLTESLPTVFRQKLTVFDEVQGSLRLVTSDGGSAECHVGTFTEVFEVVGPDRVLSAFVGRRLGEVDLSTGATVTTYGPSPDAPLCRSRRVVMSSGDELLSWVTLGPTIEREPGRLSWRRDAGSPWQTLALRPGTLGTDGVGLIALGELVVASMHTGATGVVGIFERDPRRPELPPRHCGDLPVGVDVTSMARVGDRVLIGGSPGGLTWVSRL